MNQKVYSILFCALLASTFVHELRAKGVGPNNSQLEFLERAASNEVCTLKCSDSESSTPSFGLTLLVVEDLLIIANQSANVALVINATSGIVVLLNGSNGSGVVIDISAQVGVYIKSGLWVASSTSLVAFIKSLSGGLKSLFNISGATKFKLSSVSSAIYKVINAIVGKLVANIEDELSSNPKHGLQLVLSIVGGLVKLFNGVLKGILGLVGGVVINLKQDLAGLFNLLQGIASIVEKIGGSIASLIEKGVKFDLGVILGAANGLEVLVNLILQIGAKVDIGSALGSILNNAESLFKLLAQLGGNTLVGLNGFFQIIYNIIALINKNISLEKVINNIIQFVVNSSQSTTSDLSSSLTSTLEGLLEALERVNLSKSLSGLVKIVQSLIKGNFTVGNVNISAIIKKLLAGAVKGATSLLQVVVDVVLQLRSAVDLSKLVSNLLLVLIFKLGSAMGVKELKALGIKLQANSGSGGILKQALSSLGNLAFSLLSGNLFESLTKVPGIGEVIKALSSALQSAGNGGVKLRDCVSSVKDMILGLIQVITGIPLRVSPSVISKCKSLLEVTSSSSASVSVSLSFGESASFSSS